jgi:hypothetical protein
MTKHIRNSLVAAVLALGLFVQSAFSSILVDYYRLPPAEREKVTHDQATWDQFNTHLIKTQSQAVKDALAKLQLDGLSREERFAKIDAAMRKSRDPRDFNLEKDWHIIAYLLTGDAKLKEEHLPNAPLHNVIFGGLKASVTTGYGPVRYFDRKLVVETAAALAGADRKVIAGRYDPDAMKKLDIYAPPEANEKKAILQVVEELTAFFQRAAAAHEDVITFVW